MRAGPSGTGGIGARNGGSRVALLVAVALSVGVSLALGFSASVREHPGAPPSAAAAAVAPLPVRWQEQGNQNVSNNNAKPQLSRSQVVSIVQRRYRARVVRSHTLLQAGHPLYEFRLLSLSASKVWTVRIDAASGAEVP